jgi:hypothetical protein
MFVSFMAIWSTYFTAVWYILWSLGRFYGHLVYFPPVLVYFPKENLATLHPSPHWKAATSGKNKNPKKNDADPVVPGSEMHTFSAENKCPVLSDARVRLQGCQIFLTQYTKAEKNAPNYHNITK